VKQRSNSGRWRRLLLLLLKSVEFDDDVALLLSGAGLVMRPHVTSESEIGGTDSAALRTSRACLRLCGSCVTSCTSFFRGSDPATQEEKEGNRHPPHVRFPPTSQPRGCACVELRLRAASCCEPRFSTDLLLHVSRGYVCQCCDYVMFAAWRKTRSWLRMNTLACASLP